MPETQEVNNQADRTSSVLLQFNAQPHKWLTKLVKRLSATGLGAHVAVLTESLKLARGCLMGHKTTPRKFFDRNSASLFAKMLDDLSLLRREPGYPCLIIGSEVI